MFSIVPFYLPLSLFAMLSFNIIEVVVELELVIEQFFICHLKRSNLAGALNFQFLLFVRKAFEAQTY